MEKAMAIHSPGYDPGCSYGWKVDEPVGEGDAESFVARTFHNRAPVSRPFGSYLEAASWARDVWIGDIEP